MEVTYYHYFGNNIKDIVQYTVWCRKENFGNVNDRSLPVMRDRKWADTGLKVGGTWYQDRLIANLI